MVSLVLGNGRMRSMNKRVEGHFFPIVCFQIMTNVIVKREYLKEDVSDRKELQSLKLRGSSGGKSALIMASVHKEEVDPGLNSGSSARAKHKK